MAVSICEPSEDNGAVVTRYRVEWCTEQTFENASAVIIPAITQEYVLRNLPSALPCYVRVSACNLRGFGIPISSTPPFVVPSSWRDFGDTPDRPMLFREQVTTIEGDMVAHELGPPTGPVKERTRTLRASLFMSVKFHKLLKKYVRDSDHVGAIVLTLSLLQWPCRGVYLALAVYTDEGDERVIVNGNTLPVVFVEESPGDKELSAHVQWLQKVDGGVPFVPHNLFL